MGRISGWSAAAQHHVATPTLLRSSSKANRSKLTGRYANATPEAADATAATPPLGREVRRPRPYTGVRRSVTGAAPTYRKSSTDW